MADPDTRRPTILLVDDNKDILEAYAELMRVNGMDPITASTGEAALELAFRQRPDAIVMDMWMPGMDGFETVRALRADERTRATPLIGFTSLGFSQRKAEQAGCDALLRKTSPPEALLALVRNLLYART